jgi:hypothetical protein
MPQGRDAMSRYVVRLAASSLVAAAAFASPAWGGANEAREIADAGGGFAGERVGLLQADYPPKSYAWHTLFSTMTDFGTEEGDAASFSGRRSTYVGSLHVQDSTRGGSLHWGYFFDYELAMFKGHAGESFGVDSRVGKVETGLSIGMPLHAHRFGFGLVADAQYRRRTVYVSSGTHEYEQRGLDRMPLPTRVQAYYVYAGKTLDIVARVKSFGYEKPKETYVDPLGAKTVFNDSRERYPFELTQGLRWKVSSGISLLQSLSQVGTGQAADEEWSMSYVLDDASERPSRSDPRERDHMEATAGAEFVPARGHKVQTLLFYEERFYATPSHASLEHDNLGQVALHLGYGYGFFSTQLGAALPQSRTYTASTRADEVDWRTDGDTVETRQQKYTLNVALSTLF